LRGENYQGDLRQKGCLDGWIKDMTKNTGEGWKEIGNDRKEGNLREEEQWR